jgi:hypothetical protein
VAVAPAARRNAAAQPQPLDRNGGIKGKRKSKNDKLREAVARARDSVSR